jgi:GT2 family glycosyltransferase
MCREKMNSVASPSSYSADGEAPTVWCVVTNWNRPGDTARCVESLKASAYPSTRILVVDNGSESDNYRELLRTVVGAEIIRSETNLGFGMGSNLGIRYALDRDASYVLLVNNDTFVDAGMIGSLVEAMRGDPSIGVAGPIIYYSHEPDRVWFAGYRIRGKLYVVRRGLHLKRPFEPVEDVDFVSGCGMLVRRETMERVGMFSPEYFMYYEDLDLCVRVKKAGWRIVCATSARMWHAVSASSGGAESPMKEYYQVRSSLIFYRRHTHGVMFVVNVGLRLLRAGYGSVSYLLRKGWNGTLARRYLQGIRQGVWEDSGKGQT